MLAFIVSAPSDQGLSLLDTLIKFAMAHPVVTAFGSLLFIGMISNIFQRLNEGVPLADANDRKKAVFWYVAIMVAACLAARGLGERLYFIAFMLGSATAAAEIIGKFKDAPGKALSTQQAVWYLALNGAVSSFAVYVLLLMKWGSVEPLDRLKLVLTAGLGAMVVVRAKLFSSKIGDQDVSVGPEQILKVYLDFMEQDIDRIRAQRRIDFVRKTMDPLKFSEIHEYTLTMLDSAQTLTEERRKGIKESIEKIAAVANDENKSFSLGFLLSKEMGEDFVNKLYENPRPRWLTRAVIAEKPTTLVDKIKSTAKLMTYDSVNYFAFGSSMSSAVIRKRLGWGNREKFAQLTTPRPAILKGYRLMFSLVEPEDGPADVRANIVADPTQSVEGVVYRMSKQTVDFLDYKSNNSSRRPVTVELHEKDKDKPVEVEAEAYVVAAAGDPGTPSREYLGHMLDGAREHGLSPEYIAKLEQELAIVKSAAAAAA